MAGEERFTPGEISRALKDIKLELQDIKKELKVANKECGTRKTGCNREFYGALQAVQKDVHRNSADIDWMKRGFWACFGSLTTIVVGVVVFVATKVH